MKAWISHWLSKLRPKPPTPLLYQQWLLAAKKYREPEETKTDPRYRLTVVRSKSGPRDRNATRCA